ncbi:DUF1295 domain-containing protein, partial [bacterium]
MAPLTPPFYFLAGLAGSTLLHFFYPGMKLLSFPWTLLGIPVIVWAFWIELKADQQFKQHGTTVKPGLESTKLVTDGAFKVSRNPMYLGMVGMLFGLAILFGTLTPWLAVIYMFLILHYGYIIGEEKQD